MRKGQITIFILVGIVVIAAFSMIFFLKKESPQEDLEGKNKIIIDNLLSQTPFKNYVSGCIEDTMEAGMKLAGMQGGV
ncbi:MAG: hypothetical protein KJ709_01570, partial [Nanoarchaeota archaeon]|nr:hypothetical protein [Nanoarchaeota archaeon]